MRTWSWVLSLACLPMAAMAQSVHTVKLINDTRSTVVSFWLAPAGSDAWVKVDFTSLAFDSQFAYDVELRGDQGCLRDFRTVLSDGRTVVADHFDVCRRHYYRVGVPFRHGHPGTAMLP